MTATNPELRHRLLAEMPGLRDLEPKDREYFLEMEEDLAEFRATGAMPARMAERLAEARKNRTEFRESFRDMSDQDWESFESELEAEHSIARPSTRASGSR